MNEAAIKTIQLGKVYEGNVKTEALKGVNVVIERGDYACIVGPSGHGKSTLLHLMGGLDRPSSGKILIDGTDITNISDNDLANIRAEKIGFVFQFFNLIPNLTAIENIQLSLMFGGFPAPKQGERALELLSFMGLEEKANAKPGQLSGGQQQRVAIARALANEPDILLMDEPTGNLDSQSEDEVLSYIHSVQGKEKTVVIVSHNERIARKAQTVIRLHDGKIAN
ncbi:ABC transporter ATP-binding protein [Chloroflexota bacterium]